MIIEIFNHIHFFSAGFVDGISRIVGGELNDEIRILFSNLFKDVSGNKAGGHGFRYKFSLVNEFKHQRAYGFRNIFTDRKIEIQGEGQFLAGQIFNTRCHQIVGSVN